MMRPCKCEGIQRCVRPSNVLRRRRAFCEPIVRMSGFVRHRRLLVVVDSSNRHLLRLIEHRYVHVEDVAVPMSHPVESVFDADLRTGTHGRESVAERVKLVLLPIWESAVLAEFLDRDQETSVVQRLLLNAGW